MFFGVIGPWRSSMVTVFADAAAAPSSTRATAIAARVHRFAIRHPPRSSTRYYRLERAFATFRADRVALLHGRATGRPRFMVYRRRWSVVRPRRLELPRGFPR